MRRFCHHHLLLQDAQEHQAPRSPAWPPPPYSVSLLSLLRSSHQKKKSKKKMKKGNSSSTSRSSNIKMGSTAKDFVPAVPSLQALFVHLISGLGLAVPFWAAYNVYSIDLVSEPSQTLLLLWAVESAVVVLFFSLFRINPKQCSYLRAVGRGVLALPIGALMHSFAAVALGAPVGIEHLSKTMHWSLLMSSLTFVPAASVLGSSWAHWQRIFAQTKPNETLEYMICVPAHGAVIGAWLGAWPMPLDWEKTWQDWPICVTYGALAGYLVGLVACFGFVLLYGGRQRIKAE